MRRFPFSARDAHLSSSCPFFSLSRESTRFLSFSRLPVRYVKPGDTLKLSSVCRHELHLVRHANRRYQQIVRANWFASSFEFVTEGRILLRRSIVEGQRPIRRQRFAYNCQPPFWRAILSGPVQQLGSDDGTGENLLWLALRKARTHRACGIL